tara:strand:- start:2082 stop:2654 length:573 start_codon:yes stop_codon:yes gene_type:complete
MGVPVARKIIAHTWVLAEKLYTETLEEGGIQETWGRADPVVGKPLAGHSRAGEVAVEADQKSDAWTSMTTRTGVNWDDEFLTEKWEDSSYYLGPFRAFIDDSYGSNAYPLQVRDVSIDVAGSTNVKFLYIENVGSNAVRVALHGNDFFINIDPGSNFYARLEDVKTEDIRVKLAIEDTAHTSEIKYLAAI